MADEKITDLTALTGANVATGDQFVLVDVSDTTMDATGTDKKMTADELAKALATTLGVVGRDKLWDTKGDLAVATGADAASKLAVGADATVLTADSAQTTGAKWKLPSRSTTDTHTDTGPVNTTAETTCASQAIPTTIAAGDVVKLHADGDSLNNSGSSATVTLKAIIGGTTVVTSTAVSMASGANRRSWQVEIDVLVVSTSDQRLVVESIITGAGAASWGMFNNSFSGCGDGTAAEDLTSSKNLQLSATLSAANASLDFLCHKSWLEVIKR